MKACLYSIYDKKSGLYTSPFPQINDAVANRVLVSTLQGGDSFLVRNPGDYQLVRLGEFDDITGLVSPEPVHVVVEVSSVYHVINKGVCND